MNQPDLVRLSFQCPELDFPISLPFIKLSQLHTARLFSEIGRVLQSYEQFVLDETLEIELIHSLKEHFNAIIYEGPASEKKIYLYLYDHHYDVITAMPVFSVEIMFAQNVTRYDHKVDHSCNNVCHQCYKTQESGDEDWIYCNDCDRYFISAECYEMHKQETSTGKSTCYTNFECRKCNPVCI
ncbi:unnamed protein product [Mytilus edulis]|uniref:Uncharacterized protein n=1 Tax=Mytilus edulis TaxID=6550 RepID=A0A8S3QJS9_MYTED|nr:unnamed protein product [Mytilus edulis]